MDDIHLSREILRAADDGRLPRSFVDEIRAEHLLSLCPHCRAEVEAYEAERRAGTSALSRVFQILSVLLERWRAWGSLELQRAERDLRELLVLSPEERIGRIERARGRFRSPALVRLLFEESRGCIPERPAEAFQLADLARRVANRDPRGSNYFDSYVLATAYMGNARRASGNLQEANQHFLHARSVMAEHGVTDLAVVARVDDLMGSLRKDQRSFSEAERLLKRAAVQFDLIHAPEDAARVLINLGDTYRSSCSFDLAIETTRSALDLLGPESDLKLHIAGHYNLTLQLVQAGRFEEAAELLEDDEGLYRQVQEPWLQLRLVWLRGDLAAGQQDLAAAERAYRQTRDGFISLGIGYDAAIVSLDLAALCLRQGRTADVRQIAEEMLPIFQAQDVHREALAALALFQEAARKDQLTVERTLEVAAYLREARSEPSLRFEWRRRQ